MYTKSFPHFPRDYGSKLCIHIDRGRYDLALLAEENPPAREHGRDDVEGVTKGHCTVSL